MSSNHIQSCITHAIWILILNPPPHLSQCHTYDYLSTYQSHVRNYLWIVMNNDCPIFYNNCNNNNQASFVLKDLWIIIVQFVIMICYNNQSGITYVSTMKNNSFSTNNTLESCQIVQFASFTNLNVTFEKLYSTINLRWFISAPYNFQEQYYSVYCFSKAHLY